MTSYLPFSNYPAPVYFARGQAANGAGAVIDIADCTTSRQPPIIQGSLGGGVMTVQVQGSHDNVIWADHSGGGFTADFSKDLVQGYRFWRTVVSGYASGAFTGVVGAVSDMAGRIVVPHLLTVSNNVPTQSG